MNGRRGDRDEPVGGAVEAVVGAVRGVRHHLCLHFRDFAPCRPIRESSLRLVYKRPSPRIVDDIDVVDGVVLYDKCRLQQRNVDALPLARAFAMVERRRDAPCEQHCSGVVDDRVLDIDRAVWAGRGDTAVRHHHQIHAGVVRLWTLTAERCVLRVNQSWFRPDSVS